MPKRIAQAVLLGLAAVAAFLAWRLSVDYFDSYDILNNARRLVGNGFGSYVQHRGLAAGPLFAPLALVERWFPSFPFFQAAHFLSAVFAGALVCAFFKLATLVSPRHAWAGTVAFALNPILVHYGIFAKEDVPAALFTTLGFAQVLKGSVGLAPLWFTLAGGLRPNLIPAIVLTLLLYRREKRGALRLYGGWLLGTLALAWGVYAWARIGGLPEFFSNLFTQWKDNGQAWQPPSVAIVLLGAAVPVAVAVAAAIGALRLDSNGAKLAALWAAVFTLVQTVLVAGKETRYFLPALPAIYLLAVHGFERLPRWAAVAWWLAFPAGLLELARFQDPVFREPKSERLAQSASALSRTGRVVWVGPFYPVRPAQHLLHERDDYFSLFHLWRNGLSFHLKREVMALPFPEIETVGGDKLPRNLAKYLQSGDSIVWNREPKSYATRDLPESLSPLVLARVEIHARDERLPLPGPFEEYGQTMEGVKSMGWRLEGEGTGGTWWLQFQGASEQPLNKTEYTQYTL